MKKLILIIIVLVAIGGAVAAYYMKKNVVEPTVTTAQITRGDIVETVGATGTLQAVETVDVGTQVSGVVEALYADFNHIVKKGQIIARLDPSLIQTQVEQREASVIRAKADLDRLRVQLADSQRKYEQAKNLWAKQLIPKDQLDTAELNVKQLDSQIQSSKASLTVAEADLNTQRVNLGHTIIKAPIDGIVISRNVDQGQTVQASMNAPVLYQLAEDLTKMQVLATIDESEIGKIRPGQAVRFTVDAQPGETFHGTVAQVRLLPTTVQNVVTYTTVIDVPNPEYKLKPGMTATVNVEIARRDDVLRAPNASLRFRPTNDIFAALKQDVPPEMQRGGGRMGGGRDGQPGSAQGGGPRAGQPGASQPSTPTPPAAGAQAPAGQPRPQQPQAQSNDRGGGDRGADRPRGEGGGRGNMTPEEREARRKQMEERMKNMSPEERAQWDQRMREGRGRGNAGGGRGNPSTGSGQAPGGRQNARSGNPGGQPRAQAPPTASGITATNATTIDALFAPPVRTETRGRVWLWVNKQLKSVAVRTGVTDGTWTEIIESPETAQLPPNTEVVINVVTGLEPTNRPAGGQGGSPLMPQRGQQPGRGGPPQGGRGR